MKNKRLIITIGILVLATAIFYYKAKRDHVPMSQDILLVGTNAEFPPFTFINDENKIVGFDIDIATEVAKNLGKKMEIIDRSFDMLIPEAQNGSIHIIAAGMTATQERAQQIIFTKPYLKGEPLVVVTLNKNPIRSIQDLNGKEVVVNEGYTADSYASALPEVMVKRLPAPAESVMDLMGEKSFAYISAYNAVKPYIEKFGTDKFNIFTVPNTSENTAMGISKMYPELLQQIQPILDQMELDGTIETLKKKWKIQ